MITVEHLTKKFGDFTAIDDISFELKKGEILGFLGPNGAGKSTTMKILTGYFPASSGKATIAGFDIFKEPLKAKARIGYLPENPPLYLDMTVSSYLEFVAKLRGLPSKVRKENIAWALSKCNLTDVADRIIQNLSKGYKQRVGLAQAIVHKPDILILDEPTIGLDPKQIIEIRDLIKSLKGNHSVILSTHILPEVKAICDRVLIVNRGRVILQDTIERLEEAGKSLEEKFVEIISQEAKDPHANQNAAVATPPSSTDMNHSAGATSN